MRTTLIIPDELMEKVRLLSGEELLALRGKIRLDYDWELREDEELKAQRQRESFLEERD